MRLESRMPIKVGAANSRRAEQSHRREFNFISTGSARGTRGCRFWICSGLKLQSNRWRYRQFSCNNPA
jgi:hypothetical protein